MEQKVVGKVGGTDENMVAIFALIYGASGRGKSTDMAATFPNGMFICRPGGMQSAESFLGVKVREVHIRTLEEVIQLIPLAKQHGHDAIIVDDLSLLAESTERDFDTSGAGGRNRYAKFGHLNTLAAALREQGRYVGIHFAANAHERASGKDANERQRIGGPKLPSWNMSDSVVHEASLVLRCARDESRAGAWKSYYGCGESGWVSKDRLTSAAQKSPQNLRAIMTAGGYTLARAPGLEWQDQVVDHVTTKLQAGDDLPEVVGTLWDKLTGGGLAERHVAWAIRDGLCAHELRQATATRFRDLLNFDKPGVAPASFG